MTFTAHIDRLMVFAQHGQPQAYGGSDMMRADLEALIRTAYPVPTTPYQGDERMSAKPYPALCRDCKYQVPEPGSNWNSRCTNPVVNAQDEWALANTGGGGIPSHSSCRDERARKWFAPCGMTGKLWEPKE